MQHLPFGRVLHHSILGYIYTYTSGSSSFLRKKECPDKGLECRESPPPIRPLMSPVGTPLSLSSAREELPEGGRRICAPENDNQMAYCFYFIHSDSLRIVEYRNTGEIRLWRQPVTTPSETLPMLLSFSYRTTENAVPSEHLLS